MNYLKKLSVLALYMIMGGTITAQSIHSIEHLGRVKGSLSKVPAYKTGYKALIKRADKMLTATPVTVMSKSMTPPSGTKHDYMSLGRYYWPDSTKADGLPWVQRDGVPNPALKNFDREKLTQLARTTKTLALAYYLSGDEKYAECATNWIRVFFINEDTKMNPNLNYAQTVPGVNDGKGRSQGVIDTYSLIDVTEAIGVLQRSKSYTAKDHKVMKQWFADYLQWLLTSEQSLGEAKRNNNHGTARDIQVVAFANFVGNKAIVKEYLDKFPAERLFTQIEPDGRQPKELKRTLAFHYTIFNLTHIQDLFFIARAAGQPIDKSVSADGRSYAKAMDFVAPYIGKEQREWPYQQIHEWDLKQMELAYLLYRGYLLDPAHKDFLAGFLANYKDDKKTDFLLWFVEPEDAAKLTITKQ